jgi:orotate phosphoribosyltransferase
MELINKTSATPSGVLVAIDRQERGNSELSAIQEVERDFGIPVISVVKLKDIVFYLQSKKAYSVELDLIEKYHQQYGVGS